MWLQVLAIERVALSGLPLPLVRLCGELGLLGLGLCLLCHPRRCLALGPEVFSITWWHQHALAIGLQPVQQARPLPLGAMADGADGGVIQLPQRVLLSEPSSWVTMRSTSNAGAFNFGSWKSKFHRDSAGHTPCPKSLYARLAKAAGWPEIVSESPGMPRPDLPQELGCLKLSQARSLSSLAAWTGSDC